MRAFVFDTETSGLIDNRTLPLSKQPSVIEFYGVDVDLETGELGAEVDALIKPPTPVSDEIVGITGIDNTMLADAPLFSFVAPLIKTALETAPLVIAHNFSFDQEMIDIEFERLGQALAWPKVLCTVEATVHLNGFRLNLSALHEKLFGETFKGAHRARTDVMALVRCACELFRLGEI